MKDISLSLFTDNIKAQFKMISLSFWNTKPLKMYTNETWYHVKSWKCQTTLVFLQVSMFVFWCGRIKRNLYCKLKAENYSLECSSCVFNRLHWLKALCYRASLNQPLVSQGKVLRPSQVTVQIGCVTSFTTNIRIITNVRHRWTNEENTLSVSSVVSVLREKKKTVYASVVVIRFD